MKIAVASHHGEEVGGHAGRCRRFFLYEVDKGLVAGRQELRLSEAETFHELQGSGVHPLGACQALIAASMGPGLVRKLEERGIEAVITSEPDCDLAVAAWLDGSLPRLRSEDQEHGRFGHHGPHDHADGGSCH